MYALYAEGRWEPADLFDDLGRRYEGAHLTYKPWPSCRGTHAAIDAALQVRDQGLRAGDVDDVLVVGAALNRMLCEPAEQRRRPRTAIDAKFSLPFTIGRALVHGSVDLGAFAPDALADTEVLTVADRVRYEVDPDESPGAAVRCRLEVRTVDGASARVVVDTAPGGPDRPMSDADLRAKFLANAAHAARALPDEVPERIVELVGGFERHDDGPRQLGAILRGDTV